MPSAAAAERCSRTYRCSAWPREEPCRGGTAEAGRPRVAGQAIPRVKWRCRARGAYMGKAVPDGSSATRGTACVLRLLEGT